MADLNVQVTDELVIGIDVPADGLQLEGLTLDFRVSDEEQLRETVAKLGGADKFQLNPSSNLCARYGVPVTRNGEVEFKVTLHVWFRQAFEEPVVRYPAIQRLKEDAEIERVSGDREAVADGR